MYQFCTTDWNLLHNRLIAWTKNNAKLKLWWQNMEYHHFQMVWSCTMLFQINATTLWSLVMPKLFDSEKNYFIPKSSLIWVLCWLLNSKSCDETLSCEKQKFKKFKIPKPRHWWFCGEKKKRAEKSRSFRFLSIGVFKAKCCIN